MCLNLKLSPKERREAIKDKTFPLQLWKVMKVMTKTPSKLRGIYETTDSHIYQKKRNVSMRTVDIEVNNGGGKKQKYKSGFHAFLKKDDALACRDNLTSRYNSWLKRPNLANSDERDIKGLVVVLIIVKKRVNIKQVGEDGMGSEFPTSADDVPVLVVNEFYLSEENYDEAIRIASLKRY